MLYLKINTQILNNFEKVFFSYFLTFFEIWSISNIARPGGMFLPLPILSRRWQDRLPCRRHLKLIDAIQCTFNSPQIRIRMRKKQVCKQFMVKSLLQAGIL